MIFDKREWTGLIWCKGRSSRTQLNLVVFDYSYPYIILCTQRGCYNLKWINLGHEYGWLM